MTPAPKWPPRVWIARHGESLGNVASSAAIEEGLERVHIKGRDVDVALSAQGEEQARSIGRWFAAMPADERPERIISSPFRRARRTAELINEEAGLGIDISVDERLRERDLGVLEHLTRKGIAHLNPEQEDFRKLLGKFYHRPPGGESWCDVVLRLRSLLDTFALHQNNRRVVFVCHQVVILCLRYIFERLDEETILAIDKEGGVRNAAITEYEVTDRDGSADLKLLRYNFVTLDAAK